MASFQYSVTSSQSGNWLLNTGNWFLKMKLRIKGNSIRLRLLRDEVERFAAEGRISEEIEFGTNTLRYSVLASKDVESIFATFSENEIAILIPEAMARDWASTEMVGLETDQAIKNGRLTILIEKDFVCLDRPNDPDREKAYPNPNAVC
jgi:hypothetical protein